MVKMEPMSLGVGFRGILGMMRCILNLRRRW